MKKSLMAVEEKIVELKPFLWRKFRVKEIGIFGSYRRREETATSDLDILVDFSRVGGFLEFLELESFLSENLGVQVDLVMKDSLKPRIRGDILREVVYL